MHLNEQNVIILIFYKRMKISPLISQNDYCYTKFYLMNFCTCILYWKVVTFKFNFLENEVLYEKILFHILDLRPFHFP